MRLVTSGDFDFARAGFTPNVAAPIVLAITAILHLNHLTPVVTATAHRPTAAGTRVVFLTDPANETTTKVK